MPHRVLPSLMSNKGNFIISLGAACRWLAKEAETLGVEIFTGMAASEVVYGEGDRVHGVIAGEFGKIRMDPQEKITNPERKSGAVIPFSVKAQVDLSARTSSANLHCLTEDRRKNLVLA